MRYNPLTISQGVTTDRRTFHDLLMGLAGKLTYGKIKAGVLDQLSRGNPLTMSATRLDPLGMAMRSVTHYLRSREAYFVKGSRKAPMRIVRPEFGMPSNLHHTRFI